MVQPNTLYRLQPLTELDDAAVEAVAAEVHAALADKAVDRRLRARHQLGVIARHGGDKASVTASTDSLLESRDQMRHGVQGTYAIKSLFGMTPGRTVGLASATPRHRLREQITALPPVAARCLPKMSRVVDLGKTMTNISAWTRLENPGNQRALQIAYGDLIEGHPDVTLWTIEPRATAWGAATRIGPVLKLAGLVQAGNGYFEDNEDRWSRLPHSTLFLKHADEHA